MLRHAQWLFAHAGEGADDLDANGSSVATAGASSGASDDAQRACAVTAALQQLDCDRTLLSRPAAFAQAIGSELPVLISGKGVKNDICGPNFRCSRR